MAGAVLMVIAILVFTEFWTIRIVRSDDPRAGRPSRRLRTRISRNPKREILLSIVECIVPWIAGPSGK